MLTTDEQLVASALSWAVQVSPRTSEYRVEVPGGYAGGAILAAAAVEAGLVRRGGTLLRAGAPKTGEPVLISVQTPERLPASAPPEFRVPVAVAVGGAEPTRCVVRVRLRGDDSRSWIYSAEDKEEHCWPRPGAP